MGRQWGAIVCLVIGAACAGDDGAAAGTTTGGSGSSSTADDGDGDGASAAVTTNTPTSGVDTGSMTDDEGDADSTGASTGAAGSESSGEPPKDLIFEEDFEAGNAGELPDPTVWELANGAGTLELSTDRSMSGSQSLHVTSPSGSYETFIRTAAPFPVDGNKFWGRLYFWVEELPMDDFVHWTVMEARGSGNNNRVRIGGINNPHNGDFFSNTWIFNEETQGMGEIGVGDSADVPAAQWFCVEWLYDGTPDANEARIFIDGVESEMMHSLNDFFPDIYQMPTFEHLYVGWAIYQPISFPYQVWIDDIAVDDERIGCLR